MGIEQRQGHALPTADADKKTGLYAFTDQQQVTVLAALRLMQKLPSFPDAINSVDELGIVRSLDNEGIDALCESISHSGLTFSEITTLFGQDERNPYVPCALKRQHDYELEVDVPTVISDAANGLGAYVMGWVWIDREDAGLYSEDD